MKKFISLFCFILICLPVFSFKESYSADEFSEVYSALQESNKLIEELNGKVTQLQLEKDILMNLNKVNISNLELAKQTIENTDACLEGTKAQLERANKMIKRLASQKFLVGANFNMIKAKDENIRVGGGFNIGFRPSLGYITLSASLYNNDSFTLGLGYNFII